MGTVKEVHRALKARREIAYTTVMTTMARLAEKGILAREKRSFAHLYTPLLTKDELLTTALRQVLNELQVDARTQQRVLRAPIIQ